MAEKDVGFSADQIPPFAHEDTAEALAHKLAAFSNLFTLDFRRATGMTVYQLWDACVASQALQETGEIIDYQWERRYSLKANARTG